MEARPIGDQMNPGRGKRNFVPTGVCLATQRMMRRRNASGSMTSATACPRKGRPVLRGKAPDPSQGFEYWTGVPPLRKGRPKNRRALRLRKVLTRTGLEALAAQLALATAGSGQGPGGEGSRVQGRHGRRELADRPARLPIGPGSAEGRISGVLEFRGHGSRKKSAGQRQASGCSSFPNKAVSRPKTMARALLHPGARWAERTGKNGEAPLLGGDGAAAIWPARAILVVGKAASRPLVRRMSRNLQRLLVARIEAGLA